MDCEQFRHWIKVYKNSRYSNVTAHLACQLASLGKGDYGKAFRLKDGLVVKIFKREDTAYIQFLNMIYVSSNPHLPNIVFHQEYKNFNWVVLEFLDEYSLVQYSNLSFDTMTTAMTAIILGQPTTINLPESLKDLGQEMMHHAQGFCLDFKKENFGLRGNVLPVMFDGLAKKTKHNDFLPYVERSGEKKIA